MRMWTTRTVVSILDARSGTVVRTITVSGQPVEVVDVAVDAKTGHAFVTSAFGRGAGFP